MGICESGYVLGLALFEGMILEKKRVSSMIVFALSLLIAGEMIASPLCFFLPYQAFLIQSPP